MDKKICSSCNTIKPLSDFYKESRVKDGRARRCKKCHGKATRHYRLKNPEVYQKASLKYWHSLQVDRKKSKTLSRYGLSLDQYKAMIKAQDGVCAICKKECSSGLGLSVDHCHETGKIRGLLCKKCNSALGMLNDNIANFEAAILYLKNSSTMP